MRKIAGGSLLIGRICAVLLLAMTLIISTYSLPASPLQEHRLRLYHTHTSERLDIVYRCGDSYLGDAIAKLDYLLRDHRTGDVRHFDPRIFDALEELTIAVTSPGSIPT
jgi:uncharacterized protein YcbK (DUF882 family)